MKKLIAFSCLMVATQANAQTNYDFLNMQREQLGRGFVAVRESADTVALSWRYLSADPEDIAFDIFRNGVKLNTTPLASSTFFKDGLSATGRDAFYEVRSTDGSASDKFVLKADAPIGYIPIPLDVPADGLTPRGDRYSYSANDASIGDVDGDGRYEIILKWEPSNAHDNAHDGYTGNVLFDCYTLDGEKLWRIDLGRNIRAGAHYTQFMVYDLDGDNCAELVMKTADGTVDGKGNIIGDKDADYREPGTGRKAYMQGRILTGPEYLTVFSGKTGEALATVDYYPPRGNLADWGDERANRSDRFLAAVGYLDGIHPSVIMCRGYYTRAVLAAYDWDGKELKQRWIFDSDNPGCGGYAGQGNHNLRVADVDSDGCDEIIYGQCAIDHDGTGLYTTGMGHGDAMHLTSFKPRDNSLQVWCCHENKRDGSSFRDAATGKVFWNVPRPFDVGRCMAADIDPTNPGLEMWSSDQSTRSPKDGSGGVRDYHGNVLKADQRSLSINSAVWWDGDLNRELLDRNTITKYYPDKLQAEPLVTFEGAISNNWTKANACLSGDIVGDWREEVLLRTPDNRELRLYVTPIPTPYRFHTFLEDPPYRISIATQNVAYNQPPQPGFYFGSDFLPGDKVRGTVIIK